MNANGRAPLELSVVIPCYNGARTLGAQLEALAAQRWPGTWEVIFADNRSTDGSRALAERYSGRLPNFRVVDASARQGQPFALNEGARAAVGEALAFCDADDEVAPGWVEAIGTALATHDFVCSRLKADKLNPSWKQQYLREVQGDGLMKAYYPPHLPFGGGCGLGIKRTLFERIGGFDEAFPYCHDTDLCFRVQLAGTPLTFVRDAVIHVRYRSGLRPAFVQARRWAVYNVRLAERYRVPGLPPAHSVRREIAYSRKLVRNLIAVRRRENLACWVFELGWHIGILQACLASSRNERELSVVEKSIG
jgi:GT2 family glycosyltransferase